MNKNRRVKSDVMKMKEGGMHILKGGTHHGQEGYKNPPRKSDSLESKIRQISSRIWRIFWGWFLNWKTSKERCCLLYQTQNLTCSLLLLLLYYSIWPFCLLLKTKLLKWINIIQLITHATREYLSLISKKITLEEM